NRRMMKFENLTPQENRLKETVSKLIHTRTSSMPLLYGDFKTISVSDNLFVYMRSYLNQVAVVILNKDRSGHKIDFTLPSRFEKTKLKAVFGNSFTTADGKITLNLKGNSFEILTGE
ncbi:MAG: alpha-glucosidase C-terminal domain-containing protein, partial [Bacteroidota bacterium]|nr:alpha-glucosidase C-terminal domain-containing protein [Bacteroidota bacterium]